MPDPKNPPEANKAKSRELTSVEAAKRVPVKPEEVLAFRDYGTHVVVVTRDGQKFSGADE